MTNQKVGTHFECMVCNHKERLEVNRGVEVLPCPKCKGAFVDRWHTIKYENQYTSKEMGHKEESLKHVKEAIDNLSIDRIERITFDVDDRHEETIDIDISIELKR